MKEVSVTLPVSAVETVEVARAEAAAKEVALWVVLDIAEIEKMTETEVLMVLLIEMLPGIVPLIKVVNVAVTQLDAHEVTVDDEVPGNVAVTVKETVVSPERAVLWEDVNDGTCDKDAAIVAVIIGDAVLDTASLSLRKGEAEMLCADDTLL